jgi:hypothetical protein
MYSNFDTTSFLRTSRSTLGPTHPSVQWVPGFLPGGRDAGTKFTAHFHPVPRLRMSGAITLLFLYAYAVGWDNVALLFDVM